MTEKNDFFKFIYTYTYIETYTKINSEFPLLTIQFIFFTTEEMRPKVTGPKVIPIPIHRWN